MTNISINTAIFSVVYPGIEKYLTEFLDSLSRQSCKKFILFLINDGLVNVESYLQRTNFSVKVKDANVKSPAEIRKMGIQWIIESGLEKIIFADADDYFEENRVEISKAILNKHDLVVNELILTGQKVSSTPILGTHFKDGQIIDYSHIKTANCMGLSNTAINVKKILECFNQIPAGIIAFDWAFFALCIHAGAKGVFTNKTATFYRQHENNIAALHSFTDEQIMLGVRVKKDHYQVLSAFYKEYLPLANKFVLLPTQLESDQILKQKYCRAVRENVHAMPLWWEMIKSLEELGLCI